VIIGSNICEVWIKLLHETWHKGQECSPRGKRIKELLSTQVKIEDLRNNILTHPLRDLNYRFMVAEWLWIQSGRNDVAWVQRFNKNIAQFSDDGKIFRGAYGPRFLSQVYPVLALLRKDPDTRQAVIRIFDDSDLAGVTKDVPCTLSLQLLLRGGKLHGVMTMRSNDLWLGFPYDCFNFSQLTNSMAGELGVETGSFTLQAGSSHIYEQDWHKVRDIIERQDLFHYLISPKRQRIAPTAICDATSEQGLTDQEWAYATSLHCATKASCLAVLRTL
jgi:thymidylate synthase